ncbi:hypothetical protein [Flavobacterium ovatum]|uniref:hypothetical protein n=1 Tax=Flavobacterium ovatum TaxID=1928857 RepID=UPI00344EAC21
MKKKFQIIYPSSEVNTQEIHWLWKEEAEAMQKAGITVGLDPDSNSENLMHRGFCIYQEEKYPQDKRFINKFQNLIDYTRLSTYYPHIADLSIETFFVDELNQEVPKLIYDKGWDKAFIKKDAKALEHVEEGKSVYPTTSLEEMKKLYDEFIFDGKYAIRKFIEPEKIQQEERYWVLNGNIYHRYNIIPEVVIEATKRLNKLGSRYYTIDATPEFVVEVNPGESSDRHAVNSAELFASWIKKEFAS